jgi:PAS domain-containing protein
MPADQPTAAELAAAIVESLPVTVFAKDESGRFVFVNNAMHTHRLRAAGHHGHPDQRPLPAAGQAILGKTDADLWPAALARQFHAVDQAVLASGVAAPVLETVPHAEGDRHMLTRKGPVALADGRKLLGAIAVNITEYVDMDLHLRTLIDRVSDPVFTVDRDGLITSANPVFLKLILAAPDGLDQRRFVDRVAPQGMTLAMA